jgi:hypothetical protein
MTCDGGMMTSVTGTTTCATPVVCTGTMLDCRNGAADGCETDGSTDLKNCGSCGHKCPLPPHGDAVCSNGQCGVTNCESFYKDCNSNAADGCEIDSARDPNNCGSCGNKCASGANGVAACVAGKCVLTCNAPYLDCNGDPSDGCETNGANDLQNCGSCKNVCPTPTNGNAACAAGTCIVSSCNAPYLTCKAGPINSCETNTSNDVKNCSACNNVCPNIANGTPGCTNSACGIASCNAPYKDCNKLTADGCEDDTSSDVKNCGSCGNACAAVNNGTAACANSQCGIGSCNAPYMDCNKLASDGCETDTSKDAKNCGACNNVCPATQFCSAGTCISDPCQNYGGTLATLNAHIKVCTTPIGWGGWDLTKIPAPWIPCTKAQWASYAPGGYGRDYGLPDSTAGWLWIDDDSCSGSGYHREVADSVFQFNDPNCYNGPNCCRENTAQWLFALCTD